MKKIVVAFLMICACQSGNPTISENGSVLYSSSSSCSDASTGGFGGEMGMGGEGGNEPLKKTDQ